MAGEIRFAIATAKHAEVLASTMRAADVAELAALGDEPLPHLLQALQRSAFVGSAFYGLELCAMFGVQLFHRGTTLVGSEELAAVWCLTSKVVDRCPLAFVKATRRVVAELLEVWPSLFNVVDARYAGALRLLEHHGGEFSAPVSIGSGVFFPFHLRRAS